MCLPPLAALAIRVSLTMSHLRRRKNHPVNPSGGPCKLNMLHLRHKLPGATRHHLYNHPVRLSHLQRWEPIFPKRGPGLGQRLLKIYHGNPAELVRLESHYLESQLSFRLLDRLLDQVAINTNLDQVRHRRDQVARRKYRHHFDHRMRSPAQLQTLEMPLGTRTHQRSQGPILVAP